MTSARDIMTPDAECVAEGESLVDAARKMARLGVGALPICGDDERLKGMLTDRDIVVKALAEGRDPAGTTAGEFAQGKPVTIGADDSVEEILRAMSEHKVRRLPVIDGHKLVGMVSQADVARNLPEDKSVTWWSPSPRAADQLEALFLDPAPEGRPHVVDAVEPLTGRQPAQFGEDAIGCVVLQRHGQQALPVGRVGAAQEPGQLCPAAHVVVVHPVRNSA